jgi:hypothetical protein
MTDNNLISFISAPSLFLPKGGPKLLLVSLNNNWQNIINDIILDTPLNFPITVYFVDGALHENLTWLLYHSKIADNILFYINDVTNIEYISLVSCLAHDSKTFITISDEIENENIELILSSFSNNPLSNDSYAQLQRIFNIWQNHY